MASTLVCDLLGTGYHSLSVLDLFDSALAVVKKRLGAKADDVRWFEASILQAQVPVHGYDVWHDRAVFHFLIDPADRHTYVQTVLRSVKSGGGLCHRRHRCRIYYKKNDRLYLTGKMPESMF